MGEGASRFSGLFGSDDSSSSGEDVSFDEDDAGRDVTLGREGDDFEEPDPPGYAVGSGRKARPSTFEAKERRPLDDGEEDDEDLGPELDAKLVLRDRGPFADPEDGGSSSEEEELVEIRPRRTS